jgi:hypothetical protein
MEEENIRREPSVTNQTDNNLVFSCWFAHCRSPRIMIHFFALPLTRKAAASPCLMSGHRPLCCILLLHSFIRSRRCSSVRLCFLPESFHRRL